MNAIEKLQAAYETTTPGEWRYSPPQGVFGHEVDSTDGVVGMTNHHPARRSYAKADAEFIALAHNMMPELLEMAVQMDQYLALHLEDNEDAWIVRETLHKLNAKLKGMP